MSVKASATKIISNIALQQLQFYFVPRCCLKMVMLYVSIDLFIWGKIAFFWYGEGEHCQ